MVYSLTYLGSLVDRNGRSEAVLVRRIAIAICRIGLLGVVSFRQPCPSVGFAPDDEGLNKYDDEALKTTGLKMMTHHSWYLSQELATLSLFLHHVSFEDEGELVQTMKSDQGSHMLKCLSENLCLLRIS